MKLGTISRLSLLIFVFPKFLRMGEGLERGRGLARDLADQILEDGLWLSGASAVGCGGLVFWVPRWNW